MHDREFRTLAPCSPLAFLARRGQPSDPAATNAPEERHRPNRAGNRETCDNTYAACGADKAAEPHTQDGLPFHASFFLFLPTPTRPLRPNFGNEDPFGLQLSLSGMPTLAEVGSGRCTLGIHPPDLG